MEVNQRRQDLGTIPFMTMEALLQPHSQSELQQNALLVFMHYSLQQMQQLHVVLTSRCECSPQWKPAVTAAEELIKYHQNCIIDPNVRMLTTCGAHALAAVSCLEESLRWAINAASGRIHTPEYSHRLSLCRYSAHFYINALIALQKRDAEVAGLWKIAAALLDNAVSSKYKISVPSQIDMPEIPNLLDALSGASTCCSRRASGALWKLAERHLRVGWAYAVVDAVVRLTSDVGTRSIDSYRVLLSGKEKIARNVSKAYRLAAEYEDKASDNTHAGVAALWHRASELMAAAAASEDVPQGSYHGLNPPCKSPFYYAKAIEQLTGALGSFADKSRPLSPEVARASPRLRKAAEARAHRLAELVGQISCSALLTAPTGDMSVEYRRLQLLIESSETAQLDFETWLIIKEQAVATAARPGRVNAIAADLLEAAATQMSALIGEDSALDARRRRHDVADLTSLAGGICHGADAYFQNARSARAMGKLEAAEAWTAAADLLLSAVELTRKTFEPSDMPVIRRLAGNGQEHASGRYADLARALSYGTTGTEELQLLRVSCTEWDAIIRCTPGSDERIYAIGRIRAQFNAALDNALSLYVDSFGGPSEALTRLASLIGEAVSPLEGIARNALLNERTKLVDSVLKLATLFTDLTTTSDIDMDAQLTELLSNCTSLVTTTAQALVAENLELAAARNALLATVLMWIRAKLDHSALQQEIFSASAQARKAAVDVLCGSSTPNYARVQLRLQVADALLDEAQRQSPAMDAAPNAHAAARDELVATRSTEKQSTLLADEIVRAYVSAASSTASSKDPLLCIKDDMQRKNVKKARAILGQLCRQLGDALCELADLCSDASLVAEEQARLLAAREYEIRMLRESVRCYQHILNALLAGQISAATYWRQAAIIRELPALRSDRVPTTSQLRTIPEPGPIEDVLAAGSAYYEMAALAVEVGDTARAQVLLFAAKQAMETLSFLQVGQVVVPEENEARVKGNLKILSCVTTLAGAVAAGSTGAEECFQAVRQEFAALREPGTAIWSTALAARYDELHRRLQPFAT